MEAPKGRREAERLTSSMLSADDALSVMESTSPFVAIATEAKRKAAACKASPSVGKPTGGWE